MSSQPEILNVDEVAARYGTSRQRVYTLARENLIPAIRMGRLVRFSVRQLLEWEEQGGKALDGGWRKESQGVDPIDKRGRRRSGK